ncbi:MAG: GTPase domain-containing protein [Bacteroidales bacterium]|nr:GTPase domain-containing protein [Bacteroidales bacterium]
MAKLHTYNICFIGRTGNGKTSLINALFNTQFPTDTLVACTKEMYSVTTMDIHPIGYDATSVYDTPGIGEFSTNDRYQRYYEDAVAKANCVVLVTTMDRTDAPAQRLLMSLKQIAHERDTKFVIALNHIDSRIVADNDEYNPWDDNTNSPTESCLAKVQERITIIQQKFDNKFLPFNVIPVCAKRKYNIDQLLHILL